MKNEKELYLCFEEFNFQRGGYVIRTLKLLALLQCSCHFSIETCEITKCKHCAPKIKLESQWRHRAWLHTGEKVPESRGAKETSIPFGMICCSYGSQIIFAGGLVRQPDRETPEWRPPLTPSGQVWSFDPETTFWQKLDWSFPRVQLGSLIFEVNGNLYCLKGGPHDSTFEVYNSSSREWLALPDPQVYLQGHDNCSCLVNYMSLNRFACAVVGSKILISNPALESLAPHVPIICFDVNDKEKKWRVMPSLFDGEPFPFNGRALVLDLNGTHDKVMFSFRHECLIYVSRLAEDDDTGDISIPHEACLGDPHLVRNLIKNASRLSSTFVDLGDQNKVAFVMCGTIYSGRAPIGRVVIVVIEYEGLGPKYVSCEIVATRTFEYDCHYSGVGRTILTGGFVVG
uniref:uncharacterized protein LOC105353162 isoform X1 n=1 Tax=Fragaria vesca subsp. vesca TaxID=101020 RepID=UPI0005CAC57D|nr:PREDICTED: uncharacterized protein LOC105353162 isoform X1 [Fragaria vesca subsp. vesca]XP_011470260.1 PREDICTED: uncharacterized protein LOC105353162 isoform X1 [Fragaria vesca subsp. vesca]XP_011470261.1 PREDICTED: uncharacterized protein LOC105353162 isoform X1 [Fragaria vesca subsp. vesca]XP_011470262.1 PREDICTED: uncharacterized protein LOC105353162 isoform X1 [Fragaria vesca subsp. vesca]XP_011470263.1 PREDICTED: uncharacterized protein LOC105353162 isoform X1 [Fragaria vesca subsp. ve